MSGADRESKSQRELLNEELLRALSKAQEGPAGLLAFDEAFAEPFVASGHRVTLRSPDGPWLDEGERFDLVLAVGLAERAEDDRESLAALAPHLAEGGAVILAVPIALAGREPPEGARRHYSIDELASLLLRSALSPTQLLANGPELLICELRPSREVGAELIAQVAGAVARRRWDEAEARLATISEQMEDEELVREYAMLIGHVHLGKGRLAEALDAFQQASELVGPSALALTAMGAVALTANDLEAAVDLFKGALELSPTHAPALQGLGIAQRTQGKEEEALTSLDMAATHRPADRGLAEAVVELGVSLGRSSPAAHAIQRYVQRTGDERWSVRLLNRLDPGHTTSFRRRQQSGEPRARARVEP